MNRDGADEDRNGVGASFYPALIPPEAGHPTSADFLVVETEDGRGKALVSRRGFQRATQVAKLAGVVSRHTTLDTIQISAALYLSDPWFCRFLLHSCDPNLEIDSEHLEVQALRDICPGECLTIDYAATDDAVSAQFACRCGSPGCRGWIKGRSEQVNDEGRRFLAYRGL